MQLLLVLCLLTCATQGVVAFLSVYGAGRHVVSSQRFLFGNSKSKPASSSTAGNVGPMGGMNFLDGMKKAQEMLTKMENVQKSLIESSVSLSDSANMVRVTLSGTGMPKNVDLAPEFFKLSPSEASQLLSQTLISCHGLAAEQMKNAVTDTYAGMGLPTDPATMQQLSKSIGF